MSKTLVRALEVESPCKIEFMSKESFNNFMAQMVEITSTKKVTIEFPLFSARHRGVFRVIFLDKWMMGYPDFKPCDMQIIQV